MKILVINGPNLNMLGIREVEVYGNSNYSTLLKIINEHSVFKNVKVEFYQSNHEGALVDKIQEAYFEKYDGLIINPAAYTHTSVAIYDALKAVNLPTIEVHISDVNNREEFRKINYIKDACLCSVVGQGLQGYVIALDKLVDYLGDN